MRGTWEVRGMTFLTFDSYGWHSDPFYRQDPEDVHLLYHPKKRHEITIIGEKINADRITQRPRFTGIPFKLPS